MARPRKYATNADRQAAYRRRAKDNRRRVTKSASDEWYTPNEYLQLVRQVRLRRTQRVVQLQHLRRELGPQLLLQVALFVGLRVAPADALEQISPDLVARRRAVRIQVAAPELPQEQGVRRALAGVAPRARHGISRVASLAAALAR